MPHTTARGIARYGLEKNPYTPAPLDPLRREDRLHKHLRGVGALSEVETYIERAVGAGEPAFVLVSGRSGTGRTSVANHLLRHYWDKCLVADKKRFIVPTISYSGENPFEILTSWITNLYVKLKRAKLTPLGSEGFDFDDELTRVEELPPNTYTAYLVELLPDLADVLESKGAAFGVCFENLQDNGLAKAAFATFAHTRTLVVLTALDYARGESSIHELFQRRDPTTSSSVNGRYPVLELDPIRGQDAKELVQYHWARAKPQVESPFDPIGLEKAFDDRVRTAGRVLQMTGHMLASHAASVGVGPMWPDARKELEFRGDRLEDLRDLADEWVPERKSA